MPRIERFRTAVKGTLEQSSFEQMTASGWRPVAIEWEREAPGEQLPSRLKIEELPYGLRVAQDCHHLEEDPVEMDALQTIMEMIVQDATLTRIAQELNRRGFPTRDGAKWSPLSVYQIFPRLIEVTPRIFGDADWKTRRPDMTRVTWNS
jgi:hypothetical protein